MESGTRVCVCICVCLCEVAGGERLERSQVQPVRPQQTHAISYVCVCVCVCVAGCEPISQLVFAASLPVQTRNVTHTHTQQQSAAHSRPRANQLQQVSGSSSSQQAQISLSKQSDG